MKLKKLFILVNLAFFSSVYSQKIEMNEQTKKNEMNITETITIGKTELFDKISEWLPSYYTSAQSTLKFSDKTKGKIIYIGTWELRERNVMGTLFYTMTFNIEENKYTCNITNFYSEYTVKSGNIGQQRAQKVYFEDKLVGKKKLFENTESNIIQAFAELKKFINN
jgi:hypothetical protein